MSFKLRSAAPYAIIEMFVSAGILLALYVAICMDGSWTLGTNYLGDLALSANATVAAIFKWTCVFGGLLFFIAAVGTMLVKRNYEQYVAFFIALGALLMITLGFVAAKQGTNVNAHYHFMLVFFLIAMILSLYIDWKAERKLTTSATAVLVVVILASLFGMNYPTITVIMTVTVSAWIFTQGLSLAFGNTLNKAINKA